MTKIRALGDRIIVKRNTADTVSKGGIIIPDSAKEKPLEGEVIAVGNGKVVNGELQPMPVKVGDSILFGKYSGTEVELNGELVVIVREEDVLGVVEPG